MNRAFLICAVVLLAASASCAKHAVPTAATPADVSSGSATIPAAYRMRLWFVGPVVTLDAAGHPRLTRNANYYVYSTDAVGAQVDTVPSYARLRAIEWTPLPAVAASGTVPLENGLIVVDPPGGLGDVPDSSPYEFSPGYHELTLAAPPEAGGGNVSVHFQMGFLPVAWWAGPDPSHWPVSSDGDGRAVDVTDWAQFTTTPAWPQDGQRYFGPDSFRFVPSLRRPLAGASTHGTFYEIYGNRIYARSEGDTVHANAWIVLSAGGYDKDSPYTPIVAPGDPALPPGYAGDPIAYSLLLPQGMIGSPIGFRSLIVTKLANGQIVRPSQTTTVPNFDINSVFRDPKVSLWWRAYSAGKAYASVVAEDSDGLRSPNIADPVALADLVDAGGGTPEQIAQRRTILTYYVRPAPVTNTLATRR